jgi:hypothetical protein
MSNITSADGLASYSATISYNTDIFTYSKIEGYGQWETPIYNDGNIAATTSSGSGQTTNQTIAVLTLRVNSGVPDGQYEVALSNIKVSDGAKTFLISETNTKLIVDRTVPTINSLAVSTTEWTTENVTLTAQATDELSGLAEKAYSWDGQKTWTTSKTYKVSANGIYTVYVKDKAGNVSSKSITISNVYELGDINDDGNLDITDLLLLKRNIVAGSKTSWALTGQGEKSADINKDGNVDVTDILLLKRHIVAGNKEEWKIK